MRKIRGKQVLITGGAGFIGYHLTKKLLELESQVTIIDNADTVDNFFIDNLIDYRYLDITKDMGDLNGDFDYIFHLAALSFPKECQEKPQKAHEINIRGTYNVLKFAEKCGAKIIFPSAASLYGTPKYLPINEKHPIETLSVYNMTKRAGEQLLEESIVSHIFFRIFNSFGPRQSTEYIVPSFITQALKEDKIEVMNKDVRRDFIYIDDIVDALIMGAESSYLGGPINLGTGKPYSVGFLAELIATRLDVEVVYLNKETFGPTVACCDNTLAKRVLGWEPKVDFDSGLEKTITYFEEK